VNFKGEKMNKMLLSVLIVVSLSFQVLFSEIKIGISVPSADHGWTAGLGWWAQKTADELSKKNKDLKFYVVQASNGTKQVGDVEDLLVKGIKALVILPHNPKTLQRTISEAYKSGVYTIVVDRELAKPAQNIFIAGDNPGLGKVGAEWMVKQMKSKGKMVIIEGMQIPINKQRVDAFNKVISKHKGIKVLASQPADWSTQKALRVMENYLQKYKHIDAVWCQDDDMLKGVMKAIKESGRTEIKTVMGGAGAKWVVEKIIAKDTTIKATVTYNPSMVGTAIEMCVKGLRGEKQPKRFIIPAELVDSSNAEAFYFPKSPY
jgi:ribose transport system substrate-binding protein